MLSLDRINKKLKFDIQSYMNLFRMVDVKNGAVNFDFDVYLPTRKKNLQRDYGR